MKPGVQRLMLSLVLVLASAGIAAADLPEWAKGGAVSVQWRPWSGPTLAAARDDGRSVYVFVGSEQSELARATLAQTFARRETAEWLNRNFVCVFVDGEVHPDVAAFAQHYLATVKQMGGWPAHLWLTPDLQPYDGASYLPATEEWGRPGFLKSARAALDLWTSDPAGARATAGEAVALMQLEPLVPPDDEEIEAMLRRGAEAWVLAADPVNGGFGTAPKNPEPEAIRFLLARNGEARAVALRAAQAIVSGGLHDRRSGGFYRRTLDAEWKQPHRQMNLLDQARIAQALFAAADAGGEGSLRDAGLRALDFAYSVMRRPDGSWALSAEEPGGGGGALLLRGRAGPAVLGEVARALARSGSRAHEERARTLVSDVRETLAAGVMPGSKPLTVHDHLGASAALAAIGEHAAASQVRDRAMDLFLDRTSGYFLTGAGSLLAGVAWKAPVLAEPFRAEAFALMHAPGFADRGVLRGRLWWIIEYEPLPPGEILLALSASGTVR